MSRILVSPRAMLPVRTDAIQNSSANVSATCTKTGSSTIWMVMAYSAIRTSCLPKFLPFSSPMKACGRVLEAFGDVLAVLDLALLDPLRDVALEVAVLGGEVRHDEAADGEPLGQDRAKHLRHAVARLGQLGRAVLRDQPAHRNARKRIEQREHRVPHRPADILEIDVDAFRARGLQLLGEDRAAR